LEVLSEHSERGLVTKEPSQCHLNMSRIKRTFIIIASILASAMIPATQTAAASEMSEPHENIHSAADLETKGFSFNPKVSSVFLTEIFGETMMQTWYNLVDAVIEGKDTFPCPDQETYNWVMGQFPDRCFPVFTQLIEPVYGGTVENGTARFLYKTSKEECEAKIAEFEIMVEDILNSTMEPDYSDLEKALALYRCFYSGYEYDQDTFERQQEGSAEDLSSYQALKKGTGICQEISTAYSYLLMQAGVDATIMMGESLLYDYNHQWSYVRINGNNYHIDPTYALGQYGSLEFFMMTDEKRSEEFDPGHFVIASTYTQDHDHPDYAADDDTFSPLWNTNLDDFDHDAHIIYSYAYDDDGNPVRQKFDYSGF